ncbi:putative inorganic phosphate cotransporter isoform X1 [Amphibalanus amphitrite]|uniref:putative inorganic phosphate cotransporter isoform X1 n=2 Tax=Amphibalanus amphitrite TaxID=1232801 RepID=UPI001C91042E|nr:putative inorganic phosphate cotransporter isoform X1 [Amphibalanus amphitrite]
MVWLLSKDSSSSGDENERCLLDENHPYYGALVDGKRMDVKRPNGWGARHSLAVLGCLGFFVSFSLRVNMSMAIVAMVNHTALAELSHQHPGGPNASAPPPDVDICHQGKAAPKEEVVITEDGPFVWTEMMQGVILSSYFVGYTVSQIPGGRLAERVGAARTFGGGIFLTALLNLLTPVCTHWRVEALIFIRALQGVASGVTCPAIHFMLSRWVPPPERSRISTFVYIGKQLGTAMTILASGPLAGWRWAGGWQSIFYVTGGVGVLWYMCWLFLIYDTPAQHPRISARERLYIDTYFKPHAVPADSEKPVGFPWKQALMSRPLYALIVVHFCQNWGDYMIMTELPTYIRTVLHYPLSMNAFYSAIPQLVKVVFALTVSFMSDGLVNSGLGLSANRKLWNSVGMYIPALMMVGVSYTGCHDIAVISLMVGTVGFNGAIFSGYNINHMDLAPNFAGTLMGLTNCVATLAGVLAPFATGYVINGHPTLENWRTVFMTAAGFFVFGNTVFCVFGTAKQQKWNEPLAMYENNLGLAYSEAGAAEKGQGKKDAGMTGDGAKKDGWPLKKAVL